VPAPLNRNENEWVRWKNSSATPIPSEEISSAVIETYSRPRRNLLPIMFAIEPKIRTPSASRLVCVWLSELSPRAGPRKSAAKSDATSAVRTGP
jgi:hypothetical protein